MFKAQYAPTTEELQGAITGVLDELASPSAKEVRKILEAKNPSWKVPERRVAKFVKKQQSGGYNKDNSQHGSSGGKAIEDDDDDATLGITGGDDDTVLSVGSTVSSTTTPRRREKLLALGASFSVRRIMGGGNKKEPKREMMSALSFRKKKLQNAKKLSQSIGSVITADDETNHSDIVPSDTLPKESAATEQKAFATSKKGSGKLAVRNIRPIATKNLLPPLSPGDESSDVDVFEDSPYSSPEDSAPKKESTVTKNDSPKTIAADIAESKIVANEVTEDEASAADEPSITPTDIATSEPTTKANQEVALPVEEVKAAYLDDNDGKVRKEDCCAGCVLM